MATLICEDCWSPKAMEFISLKKPDILYVIANSPAREFGSEGIKIESKWHGILKTLAILSGGYVVFTNRVGFEDGIGFWGGSKVISPNGETVAKLANFKRAFDTVTIDKKLSQNQKYHLRNY